MSVDFERILVTFEHATIPLSGASRAEVEQACVTAAKLGWSNASTGIRWVESAALPVRQYFREELTPEVLETHEEGGAAWALFASFAAGWLLALQHAAKMSDAESDLARISHSIGDDGL